MNEWSGAAAPDGGASGAAWSDLISTALVGTDRRPAPDLLDGAAAVAVARRAGARPATGVLPPDPAPEETARPATPGATDRLAGLLGAAGSGAEARLDLTVEWLTTAAARGLRVSPALLPDLLDAARAHRQLRPLVAAAGGARAGWLAAQRPAWAYLLGEPDESGAGDATAWEEGTIGQRVGYLRAMRRRDPDAARELLEAGWAGETGEDRAALLAELRTGLSTADGPLLERALDDRRGQVRAQALWLLAQLPDSAYGQRMAARARACVRMDDRVLRVTPPEICDAGMRRDGIAPTPPAGVGARAWWLEELIARTPLATWPADLLALLVADAGSGSLAGPGSLAGSGSLRGAGRAEPEPADGWAGVLHRGLARAAANQGAADWAAALLAVLEPQVTADQRPDDVFLLESLYEVLPVAARAERAAAKLRSTDEEPALDRLLELCPAPWPPALAAAFREHLAGLVRRSGTGRRVRERCRTAATRLPPDPGLLDGILAGADDRDVANIAARQAVERLAETLRFRHDMIEELS